MIRSGFIVSVALLALAGHALAAAPPVWVGSWATAQQIPESNNALPTADFTDATLRQIVRVTVGGDALRVRLSNAYGTQPLTIGPVHVALALSPAGAQIDPASDQAITFSGQTTVTIPAGAEIVSDPLTMPVAPLTSLAVSFYAAQPPAQQTGHPGSRATSYYVHGNHVADADLGGAKTVDHWYNLAAVETESAPQATAIVTFGDSITDGHGATTNGNNRWPDILAERLNAAGDKVGVLNVGIGGNHILTDGLGPNALARFNRDVLAQARARYVIFFEAINDIGGLARTAPATPEQHADLVQRIEAGYAQMVQASREHGVKAIGATITPFVGSDYYHPDAASEADRQAINAWIRAPGHFDAVIDFDAVTRDPASPDKLLPAFDSGDHLHPGPAGYKAMGEAVPLEIFAAEPVMTTAPVKPEAKAGKKHKH